MKSIVVTQYGGPEVLHVQEVPVPVPKDTEVLIKVKVAGMNYADLMQRIGMYPGGPKPPFGAGFEVAGIIEHVGADVKHWRVGDAVMGFCSNGYSEYVVANAATLLAKPEQLDFRQAAAIPCQYLTAYHALLTLGQLKAGHTVLVQAAAGGLGTMLVQVARNVGATVIGTCSTAEKCALLTELGCHYPINYSDTSFRKEVDRITSRRGCELVIESVGGDVFDKSLRCVAPRGRLIVIGVASGQLRSVDAIFLLANNITVSGFHLMGYASDGPAMANAVRDLHAWLSEGKLRVVVNDAFPLEKAAEAQQFIADRKSSGKVVLTVAD